MLHVQSVEIYSISKKYHGSVLLHCSADAFPNQPHKILLCDLNQNTLSGISKC